MLQRKLNSTLLTLKKTNTIDTQRDYRLRCSVPQPPKLYSLPKLHKPCFPMRPIVSFCGSPVVLRHTNSPSSTILQPLTDKSRHKIQSTEDFISATKTVQIPDDYKLVSFDVKSLFTSIPLQLALQFTETAILQSTDPLPTEYFIDLLNHATSRKTPFRLADKRYRFGFATLTILSPPYDTTKVTHSTTTLTNKTLTCSLLERSKKMVNCLF